MEIIDKYPSLKELFNKNDAKTKDRILKYLDEPPTASDGIGHVYGFHRVTDIMIRNNFFIKLGRTAKSTPSERIEEWNGVSDFTLSTIFNIRLESLIHKFFNFAREHRKSIKNKGKNTSNNEIEWFHFVDSYSPRQIISFVNDIADLVDVVYERYSNNNVARSLFNEEELEKENVSENLLDTSIISKNLLDTSIISENLLDTSIISEKLLVNNSLANNAVSNKLPADNAVSDKLLTNNVTKELIETPLLNINTCSYDDLRMIISIGKERAKLIIEYRKKQPFAVIDDVENVKSIGVKTMVNVRKYCCV